jgi:hypothetical protein
LSGQQYKVAEPGHASAIYETCESWRRDEWIKSSTGIKLSSLKSVDILLISAHGDVQFANTDHMKMGEESLRSEHLSHLSPSLVYFDSCNLGVSAQFIQSFRDRGTQFYVAPIMGNEAGESSTKTGSSGMTVKAPDILCHRCAKAS